MSVSLPCPKSVGFQFDSSRQESVQKEKALPTPKPTLEAITDLSQKKIVQISSLPGKTIDCSSDFAQCVAMVSSFRKDVISSSCEMDEKVVFLQYAMPKGKYAFTLLYDKITNASFLDVNVQSKNTAYTAMNTVVCKKLGIPHTPQLTEQDDHQVVWRWKIQSEKHVKQINAFLNVFLEDEGTFNPVWFLRMQEDEEDPLDTDDAPLRLLEKCMAGTNLEDLETEDIVKAIEKIMKQPNSDIRLKFYQKLNDAYRGWQWTCGLGSFLPEIVAMAAEATLSEKSEPVITEAVLLLNNLTRCKVDFEGRSLIHNTAFNFAKMMSNQPNKVMRALSFTILLNFVDQEKYAKETRQIIDRLSHDSDPDVIREMMEATQYTSIDSPESLSVVAHLVESQFTQNTTLEIRDLSKQIACRFIVKGQMSTVMRWMDYWSKNIHLEYPSFIPERGLIDCIFHSNDKEAIEKMHQMMELWATHENEKVRNFVQEKIEQSFRTDSLKDPSIKFEPRYVLRSEM